MTDPMRDLLTRAAEQYRRKSLELHETEILSMLSALTTTVVEQKTVHPDDLESLGRHRHLQLARYQTITTYKVMGTEVLRITEEVGRAPAVERLHTEQPTSTCKWSSCAAGGFYPGCDANSFDHEHLSDEDFKYCFGCGNRVEFVE